MTMKGNAKFKGKLTCGLKNGIKNLVNFHTSSSKFEKFHFDESLDFQMKKHREVMSHDTDEWDKV